MMNRGTHAIGGTDCRIDTKAREKRRKKAHTPLTSPIVTPNKQARLKPTARRLKLRPIVTRKTSRPSSLLSLARTWPGEGMRYGGKIQAAICQPASKVRKAIA